MAHKNKVLSVTGRWKLVKSVNERGGVKYLIVHTGWSTARLSDIDQLFNPGGNRKVAAMSYTWKFNTRDEAEKLMTIAVLKGW
jgi:uncharacterized protein YerC